MTLPKDPEKREEYRRKLSKSKKEFYKDPEERRKLSESQKGKKLGPQTKEHRKNLSKSHIGKPGHPAWNKGNKLPPFSKEHQENLSKSHLGQVAWNKGKKTGPLTKEHRKKISKFMEGKSEEKNYAWKGGVYTWRHNTIYRRFEYIALNYCWICEISNIEHKQLTGMRLSMHCINGNWKNSSFNNWICLCSSCHRKLHVQLKE